MGSGHRKADFKSSGYIVVIYVMFIAFNASLNCMKKGPKHETIQVLEIHVWRSQTPGFIAWYKEFPRPIERKELKRELFFFLIQK
jgi:hypothetical protein